MSSMIVWICEMMGAYYWSDCPDKYVFVYKLMIAVIPLFSTECTYQRLILFDFRCNCGTTVSPIHHSHHLVLTSVNYLKSSAIDRYGIEERISHKKAHSTHLLFADTRLDHIEWQFLSVWGHNAKDNNRTNTIDGISGDPFATDYWGCQSGGDFAGWGDWRQCHEQSAGCAFVE